MPTALVLIVSRAEMAGVITHKSEDCVWREPKSRDFVPQCADILIDSRDAAVVIGEL